MLHNYVITAFRSILKNKTTFLINLIGLALAAATCTIIVTYVLAEIKFDKFHKNYDNIYRLIGVTKETKEEYVNHPAKYYDLLLKEFPGIDDVCRVYPWDNCVIKKGDNNFFEDRIFLADDTFFKMFSFSLISGDPTEVLSNPNQLIISQKTAEKLFGSNNPINQTVTINNVHDFVIKGVFNNIPEASSFDFDYIGSISSLKIIDNCILDNWNYAYAYFYLLLNEKNNAANIQNKFPEFIQKHRGDYVSSVMDFKLDKFENAHLKSAHIKKDIIKKGNIVNVYGFSIIAIIIIALACFNFINLSLSNYINRKREIGLRKSLGAQKINILTQFLVETFLIVLVASILSIILIQFGGNYFKHITNLDINFSWTNNLIYLFILAVLLTFGSGFYPSYVLSNQPVVSLNKESDNSIKHFNYYLKHLPIILQFTIAISLIISTVLVLMQIEYLDKKELGFNHYGLIHVENPYDKNMINRYNIILEEANNLPEIEKISGGYDIPPNGYSMCLKFFPKEKNRQDAVQLGYTLVEYGFLSTIEANFIEGRNFKPELSSDSSAVILTKSSLTALGTTSQEILINGINQVTQTGSDHLKVIGIIDDIHFSSLKYSLEPMVFRLSEWGKTNIIVKAKKENIKEVTEKLNKYWKSITTDWPFKASFITDNINFLYRSDRILGYVLKTFVFIAVFISLLGVIAFSSFIASKRKKEIGIRKVIGASRLNILVLLANKFVKWILFSFIISCPIVFFMIKEWLKSFHYQIDIGFSVFVISGILVLCSGVLVVIIVSYKYASINPTNTIKDLA